MLFSLWSSTNQRFQLERPDYETIQSVIDGQQWSHLLDCQGRLISALQQYLALNTSLNATTSQKQRKCIHSSIDVLSNRILSIQEEQREVMEILHEMTASAEASLPADSQQTMAPTHSDGDNSDPVEQRHPTRFNIRFVPHDAKPQLTDSESQSSPIASSIKLEPAEGVSKSPSMALDSSTPVLFETVHVKVEPVEVVGVDNNSSEQPTATMTVKPETTTTTSGSVVDEASVGVCDESPGKRTRGRPPGAKTQRRFTPLSISLRCRRRNTRITAVTVDEHQRGERRGHRRVSVAGGTTRVKARNTCAATTSVVTAVSVSGSGSAETLPPPPPPVADEASRRRWCVHPAKEQHMAALGLFPAASSFLRSPISSSRRRRRLHTVTTYSASTSKVSLPTMKKNKSVRTPAGLTAVSDDGFHYPDWRKRPLQLTDAKACVASKVLCTAASAATHPTPAVSKSPHGKQAVDRAAATAGATGENSMRTKSQQMPETGGEARDNRGVIGGCSIIDCTDGKATGGGHCQSVSGKYVVGSSGAVDDVCKESVAMGADLVVAPTNIQPVEHS